MAAIALVTGELSESATRLPSVFAATLTLVCWTLFVLPILGRSNALLTFVVLLTSVEWFRNAAHARVDMLLAAMVTLSLISLYHWLQKGTWLPLFGATVAMALAALTKGPVGIALPCITATLAMLLWREFSVKKFLLLSFAAFFALLPLGSWYLAEAMRTEGALVDVVIMENWNRLTGTMSAGKDPHSHSVFYLFGTLIIGLIPWSLLALPALFQQIRNRFSLTVAENQNRKRLLQWCLLTSGVCLFVFSIPSSKRSVYLLPMYPAAATLLTLELNRFYAVHSKAARRVLTTVASVLGSVWIVLMLLASSVIPLELLPLKQKSLDRLDFYKDIVAQSAGSGVSLVLFALVPIGLIAAIVYCKQRQLDASFLRMGALVSVFFVLVKLTIVLPAAIALSPRDFIAEELLDHHPSEITLRTSRMYAEAFYIRQLQPDLPLKELMSNSKYILSGEEDTSTLPGPLYIHRSKEYVNKPGKHLEFAIVEKTIPDEFVERFQEG
jgi:hypothetical protein